MPVPPPVSVDATVDLLGHAGYVADRSMATAVFLALKLRRPLFIEGEAGVGKTELAKVLAGSLGRRLIRLQCYEGLDIAQAAYEWNYTRQMLEIRLAESTGEINRDQLGSDLFSRRFLIERPLLAALEPDPFGEPPLLLIDELDRADEPFEAFLLELLADYQITIPEFGTIKAIKPPIVIITSNRTREIHDALKRRCLYLWIDYPTTERELEIVRLRAPETSHDLRRQLVRFVQELRGMELFKSPGVAETIDWAHALAALDKATLDGTTVGDSLGVLLKYQDDIARVREAGIEKLLAQSVDAKPLDAKAP